jgi:hypothetical protein
LIAKTNELLRKVHCSFIWIFIEFNMLPNMKRVAAKCIIMENPDCLGGYHASKHKVKLNFCMISFSFPATLITVVLPRSFFASPLLKFARKFISKLELRVDVICLTLHLRAVLCL